MPDHIAAVVIPVYKEAPDAAELLSLHRCLKVLRNHSILFAAPNRLNTAVYEHHCNSCQIPFKKLKFNDDYFTGIEGYNRLMLSPHFYKSFLSFKYILVYQLDAWVFKDELDYWCRQNYDYIGAPNTPHHNQANEIQFLKGYASVLKHYNSIFNTSHQISNVGNGGFSLRKTRVCWRLLQILQTEVKRWGVNNEDGFFKYWGNIARPLFRLPPDDVALRFSIEQSPAASLKKLGYTLPFGCHAFAKYEPDTWKPYIENQN